MQKLLGTVLVMMALSLCFVPAAGADSLDMKKMTCAEFLDLDDEAGGVFLIWLDGYLSGVTGDTRFDTDILESFANKMVAACNKSPDATILNIAKVVGIE